jgi:hypothetical protein
MTVVSDSSRLVGIAVVSAFLGWSTGCVNAWRNSGPRPPEPDEVLVDVSGKEVPLWRLDSLPVWEAWMREVKSKLPRVDPVLAGRGSGHLGRAQILALIEEEVKGG